MKLKTKINIAINVVGVIINTWMMNPVTSPYKQFMKNNEITAEIKNKLSTVQYGPMGIKRSNYLEDCALDFLFEILAGLHVCGEGLVPSQRHLRVNTWDICWKHIDLTDLRQYQSKLDVLFEKLFPDGGSNSNEYKIRELYSYIEDSNHAYEPCRINGLIEWDKMKNYRVSLDDISRGLEIIEEHLK